MKQILNKLIASFDTYNKGFSSRKLTAFVSIIVAIYVTYTLPLDMRLHALYSWQLLALLCLGIVTIQNILEFKNGNTNKSEPVQ